MKRTIQEEKLIMMGAMFENIIHQFKQPLNTISTEASGIKFQKEIAVLDDNALLEAIDNIENATMFLSNTIDDFRDFLKIDREKEFFRISKNIENIENMMHPLFKVQGIQIEKVYIGEEFELYGYPREFSHVIINLLNNAKDAIVLNKSKYKKIMIKTFCDNELYNIVITDSGGGIPDNILDKIFNSHFTTKEEAGGTGIGLAISKTIIEDHFNGKIAVSNINSVEDGKSYLGAQFLLQIPIK